MRLEEIKSLRSRHPKSLRNKQKDHRNCVENSLIFSDCSVVMDNEKYFTFDGSFMPGNANFYGDDRAECPDDVCCMRLEKFPKKILVKKNSHFILN